MKKLILLIAIALVSTFETIKATNKLNEKEVELTYVKDSTRLAELNEYWKELSRTVREGDFEGYGKTYHEDAVVIFATGKNKVSRSLSAALAGWKQGFVDTKAGKVNSDVAFRFSQRIGDATTAHETGIFHYSSFDSNGKKIADELVHFEMLLVKKNGKWFGVMEYQKSIANQEEWDALKTLDE